MKNGFERSTLVASAVLFALAGCGGGGGSDTTPVTPPPPPVTTTLSGVVAAGAPIASAAVTIKDAAGTTKNATAQSNGSYSLDVSGLKAPFVIEASGVLAGNQVVLHSVLPSVTAGTSATANVTPLTEALVATVGGTKPVKVFTTPDTSKLTPAAVDSAQTTLKTALATVLTAASVPANVDLVQSPFTANKTGLDAVLDAVKIQVATTTGTDAQVVLTNKLNPDEVVTVKSTGDTTGTITQSKLPDLSQVDAFVARLNASVATASAVTTLFPAMFDDAYLEDGETKSDSVTRNQASPELVGVVWSGPVIETCNTAGDTCRIGLTLRFTTGEVEASPVTIKKQADGSWKLYGNHYHHSISLNPVASKMVRIDGGTAIATKSAVLFHVDPTVGNVKSAMIYLQGKDGAADTEIVRLSQKVNACSTTEDWLWVDQASLGARSTNCSQILELSDADLDTLTANSPNPKFRFVLFADEAYTVPAGSGVEGDGTYSDQRLPSLPLRSAALDSAPFPQLTTASIANLQAFGFTGALDLAWSSDLTTPVVSIVASLNDALTQRAFDASGLLGRTSVHWTGNESGATASAVGLRTAKLYARDAQGALYWNLYLGCGGAGTCGL
ncbi:hypothetical protein [Niveibacterium sp.]|uniref:hypothetical protein n=1 Tax=Niveibacterium sp. TaxID=2017444 RepID=UPI0035ADC115